MGFDKIRQANEFSAREIPQYRMPDDQHRRRAALTRSHPRRKDASTKARYKVARTDALAPGESLKFLMPIRGADEECFLIN